MSPELKNAKYSEFHFDPLSGKTFDEVYSNSRCILDSTQAGQIGLTMRAIEALGAKKILWAKTESHPWYIKLKANGETVSYTVSVTAKSEYAHVGDNSEKQSTGTATGTFTLQRDKAYELTVTPNYTPGEKYGLTLQIKIVDKTNDHPMTLDVPVEWI